MDATGRMLSAMEDEDLRAFRSAIVAGADVNCADEDGLSPLAFAAETGDLATVQLLVQLGADLAFVRGQAALQNAALGGFPDVFEFLASHVSADVLASIAPGDLAFGIERRRRQENRRVESLIGAALYGREEEVDSAITSGVDVDARGSKGRAALHQAAQGAWVNIIQRLLDAGADVNICSDEMRYFLGPTHGTTPLGIAVRTSPIAVRELIDAGANLNAQDANGMTQRSAHTKLLNSKGFEEEVPAPTA